MANNVLAQEFSEPLNQVSSATIEIDTRHGNLNVDGLAKGVQLLAGGTLEYMKKGGVPSRSLSSSNGAAQLAIKGAGGSRAGLRLPWDACSGATNWHIHVNPEISLDIDATSGGGNLRLDLTGMHVSRIHADNGGGNIDVILPADVEEIVASVKSGAGNVSVSLPARMPARIHARTGLGKVVVDEWFMKVDEHTYASPDFDTAVHKVEITAESGAGTVSVGCCPQKDSGVCA